MNSIKRALITLILVATTNQYITPMHSQKTNEARFDGTNHYFNDVLVAPGKSVFDVNIQMGTALNKNGTIAAIIEVSTILVINMAHGPKRGKRQEYRVESLRKITDVYFFGNNKLKLVGLDIHGKAAILEITIQF